MSVCSVCSVCLSKNKVLMDGVGKCHKSPQTTNFVKFGWRYAVNP
jgi:hypothetical protein